MNLTVETERMSNVSKTKLEENSVSHSPTLLHYAEKYGHEQSQLQDLAKNIIKFGKKINECHHVAQEIFPNGEERVISTGTYCIEVENEISGSHYWVHFTGCRVTEIIEAYFKQ